MKFRNEKQKYSIATFYAITILTMTFLATNIIMSTVEEKNHVDNDSINLHKEVSPMSFRLLNFLFELITQTLLQCKASLCNHIVMHLISSGLFMILFDFVHTLLQNRNMSKYVKLGML